MTNIMRTNLIASLVAGVVSAGAIVVSTSNASRAQAATETLPYYDSVDLTPRWNISGHRIAPFVMTTQAGEKLSSEDLAGRVYLASFIYTRCASICPRLVENLMKVQKAVTDPRVLMVSFSVTPALDTPVVLADFARDRGIDVARWKLLTGEQTTIYALARDSFFADDTRLAGTGADNDFLHTEKIALVDGTGRLRGIYNGTQPAEIDHAIEDIGRLLGASWPTR